MFKLGGQEILLLLFLLLLIAGGVALAVARRRRAGREAMEPLPPEPVPPPPVPRFPWVVTAAGGIWIAFGGVILAGTLAAAVDTPFLGRKLEDRGAHSILAVGGCLGLVGWVFVLIGVQTARGTAAGTLGNGVGSILIGILLGWNLDPQSVVAGSALLAAGILAFVGQAGYRRWRTSRRVLATHMGGQVSRGSAEKASRLVSAAGGVVVLVWLGVIGAAAWLSERSIRPLEEPRLEAWTDHERAGRVPGLGEAHVWHLGTRDGQRTIVIWVDIGTVNTGGGSGSTWSGGGLTRCYASVKSEGGRSLEWRWEAWDGGRLALTVNGAGYEYDPAKGSLLLVSTRSGSGKVLQLDRDVTKLRPQFDPTALKDFARGDQEIARFFSEAEK